MIRFSIALLAFFTALSACVEIAQPFSKVPPGIWRAELEIDDEHQIPFNFEISYDENDQIQMEIINGKERIEVSDIDFGRNKKLLDTLFIDFPLMDSHIKAIYKENVIEGFWVVRNRDDYQMPFVANYGQSHRFSTDNTPPITNVAGRWQATFEIETKDEYPAIGEFTQDGNVVEGTFLTETGDYRYLAGELQGDELMLSCFDGSHAFLFTAKVSESKTMLGQFFSGNHYETNWTATKNENAKLTDPYALTKAKNADKPIDFSLPNTMGKMVSLDEAPYAGKPKLIMLMGTWCPNCLDESKFILDYLNRHPQVDLEVVAVAFERHKDEAKAKQAIKTYKDRLDIPYEMLYGGYFDKAEATENFGYLDKIISYPTLLFVDQNNLIQKVHTGFSGPATSTYEAFVKEFENEIQKLTS